jgi:O-antigen ligase
MTLLAPVAPPSTSREVSNPAHPGVVYRDSLWFSAARIILLSSLLFAPLAFGAVRPWAWAALAGQVVVAGLCWALGCVQQQGIVLAWTPLYIPAVLFPALAAAQLASGKTIDPIATRDAVVLGCVYFILFALAITLLGNAALLQWIRFGKIVTVYTFLLSIFAIVQFFSSPDKIYWTVVPRWGGNIFGPYVNHNHYAGLMEMLIALTSAFWLNRQRHDAWNWFAGFATLIALASVALSGSRTGIAAVLLEMVLLLCVALVAQRRQHRTNSPVPALAFALLCALLLAAWIIPSETTARLQAAVHSPDASLADRITMARDSLGIFRAHLLTGSGLGSFEVAYPEFQSLVTDLRIDHAHNDYAELLAETGIAGGILAVAGLGIFFWVSGRNFREPLIVAGNPAVWLRLGATIGCIGLLVHSFFDFNLHIPANAAWFFFVGALAAVQLDTLPNSRSAFSAGYADPAEVSHPLSHR